MEKVYEALAHLEEIVKKDKETVAAQALVIEDLTRRLNARQGDLRTSLTFGRSEGNDSEDLYNATPRAAHRCKSKRISRWDKKPAGWHGNNNDIRSDEIQREVPQHHSESDDESRGSNINNAGLRGGDAAALQEVIESSPRSVYKRFPFRQDRPLKSTEQTPASAPKRTASAPEPPVSAPEPPTSAPEPRRTARVPKKKEFPDYIVDQSLSKRVRRV